MVKKMDINLDTHRNINLSPLIPRRIDVWVPPQYQAEQGQSFPVLYMHDGQNLFHRRKFIKRTWGVAEHISELSGQGVIRPAIVVGLWHSSNRMGDYLPYKPLQSPQAQAELSEVSREYHFKIGEQLSDTYLRWIVEHVKPFIDQNYRTLTRSVNTFIMGSSMGGLISIYAVTEYPEVFGGAGCLSTHWPITSHYMMTYLRESLPPAGSHKIYFDHGTEGLDKDYGPFQAQVDEIMQAKGYHDNMDWMTRVFPGEDHNETAWAKRLDIPLRFLLGFKD